jgi:hypothetical protein
MIHEIAEVGVKPVVVSVGRGGLLCGLLEGLHQVGWTDVPASSHRKRSGILRLTLFANCLAFLWQIPF